MQVIILSLFLLLGFAASAEDNNGDEIRPKIRPDGLGSASNTAITNEKNRIADELEKAITDSLLLEPLSYSEIDNIRNAITSCWKPPKLAIKVTLALELYRDGTVNISSIRLVSASKASKNDTYRAFNFARRAIIQCQKNGFNLPKDKYEMWRSLEIVFDPT